MNYLMTTLIVVHIVVSLTLIVLVLFQADKGEGLSGAFGGGASYAVFGDRGPEPFLAKLTIVAAVVFMLTSLTLAYLTSKHRNLGVTSIKPPVQTKLPLNTGK
jgi:preprotein translocase subunit SecG